MTFENLFSIGAGMRVALGVIFALFLLCFVLFIIEETFLGGRQRRKALKVARVREIASSSTSDLAPQNSNTSHPPR